MKRVMLMLALAALCGACEKAQYAPNVPAQMETKAPAAAPTQAPAPAVEAQAKVGDNVKAKIGHCHPQYKVTLYGSTSNDVIRVWYPDCSVDEFSSGYVFKIRGGKIRISGTVVVEPLELAP